MFLNVTFVRIIFCFHLTKTVFQHRIEKETFLIATKEVLRQVS